MVRRRSGRRAPRPVVAVARDSVAEPLEPRRLLSAVTVTTTSDSAAVVGSLRYFMTHTGAGDVINFNIPTTDPGYIASTGTYVITLASQLELTHNLTISGPGASALMISGNNATRAFLVDPAVTATISGLTVNAGSAFGSLGGGIYCSSGATLNLSICTISNCSASYGGGVENDGATTATNCKWLANFSNYGGAINGSSASSLNLNTCSFMSNSAGNGGAILGGNMTVTGTTFTANTASFGGALETLPGATPAFNNCAFTSNSAGSVGGAIVVLANSSISLTACTASGNSAGTTGGAVFNNGSATVTTCTFDSNSAGTVPSNPDGGGAIFNNAGATLVASATTFSNNAATANGGAGGALLNIGTATITSGTFFRNVAAADGGAAASYGPRLVLINSTLAGNTAGTRGGGVAVVASASALAVTNVTVSTNSAAQAAGGVFVAAGASATLANSIVAGNVLSPSAAPSDLAGAAVTGSNNLIGTGGAGGLANAVNGNLVGVASPGLAPLGDYGGPTRTMALTVGSPALNAGSNALALDAGGAPLQTDQRGLPRVTGAAVDIGAYEAQPPASPAGLSAVAGADQVSLAWNSAAGAAAYNVYRGTTPGGESALPVASGVFGTTFLDTAVAAGTTYYYQVAAASAAGQSARSTEAFATPVLPVINGTAAADSVVLTADADGLHVDWTSGTTSGQALLNDPVGLTINGAGGNDAILLNQANGSPMPALLNLNGTFTVNGLQGPNPLAGRTWNINRSTLFVTYANPTSDPIASLKGYIKNAYNGGAWTGTPTPSTGVITSQAAASDARGVGAIGYADFGDGTGINQTANTVVMRYTIVGDTDLDGAVGLSDYTAVVRNFATGTNWDQGAVTYGPTVSLADYTAVVRNFGSTVATVGTLPALNATQATRPPTPATSDTTTPTPAVSRPTTHASSRLPPRKPSVRRR